MKGGGAVETVVEMVEEEPLYIIQMAWSRDMGMSLAYHLLLACLTLADGLDRLGPSGLEERPTGVVV